MATDFPDKNPSSATAKADTQAQGDESIRLTTRGDRSLYMRLIQIITRSFRSHLGRAKKKQPVGSIKLKAPVAKLRSCPVSQRTVCDIHIYDILSTRKPSKEPHTRIYYFCGGGWQSPPSGQHWAICAELAKQIPGAIVSVVSYPLAPNNTASTAFPWLLKLYRKLMDDAKQAGDKTILAGDSSGGNIILGLVLEALREDAEHDKSWVSEKRALHPVAIMAICPSVDLTRSNPDIDKVSKFDPILTTSFIKSTAKAWVGDWEATDARLSPINADLSLLSECGIRVHGVTGGSDILGPDAILFRKKCADEGVKGEWLHWEKQMHCFVLTWSFGLREAKEAVSWIVDVLKKE